MKFRDGFISNSSSSSFIIRNKDNWEKAKELLGSEDYFIFKDVMYTSMIHNEDKRWSEFYALAGSDENNYNEGDSCSPYGAEDYFEEVDGVKGYESVWLPIELFTTQDYLKFGKVPRPIAEQLYRYVKHNTEVDAETFKKECLKIYNLEYDE